MPLDLVGVALPALLSDGCLRPHPLGYVIPNYIEAQEAPKSDRLRALEMRARRRDRARASVTECDAVVASGLTVTECDAVDNPVESGVTECDAVTRAVTERDESVPNLPNRHDASQSVTERHSVLCRAVPSLEENALPARAIPGSTDTAPRQSESPELRARRACAETLWNAHQRARRAVGVALGQKTEDLPTTDQGRRLLAERIADQTAAGVDLAEVERRALAVIARVQAECERDRTVRYLNGAMWEPQRFDKALAMVGEPVEPTSKRINGAHGTRRRGLGVLLDRIAEAEAAEAREGHK